MNPDVAVKLVLRDHIVAGIKPGRNLKRVLPGLIGHRINPPLGVHIQKHGAKGFDLTGIKPVGQGPDRAGIAKRIDKEFIGIDHEGPVIMAVFLLQPVQPIDPKAGPLVA